MKPELKSVAVSISRNLSDLLREIITAVKQKFRKQGSPTFGSKGLQTESAKVQMGVFMVETCEIRNIKRGNHGKSFQFDVCVHLIKCDSNLH